MIKLRLSALAVIGAALVASGPVAGSDAVGTSAPEGQAVTLGHEVVSRRPHDHDAYTQGLVLDRTGRLFESTGLQGRSSVREVDAHDGEVLRIRELPDEVFGEGLALVDERLVQLTWKDGLATVWDADTFEPLATYAYDGEGWGLCDDGRRLVMSDGSDRLTFRDRSTFEVLDQIGVTLDGEPLDRLNELECVDGAVWANVYLTDRIVRIDPNDGIVTGVLDLDGIIDPDPDLDRPGAVLNGIAYDGVSDTYLITGKLWPELIEIRITEAGHGS